jgi:hypothetical protein
MDGKLRAAVEGRLLEPDGDGRLRLLAPCNYTPAGGLPLD